jgi:hypothetical protein
MTRQPKYLHFLIGAALGACAGVWVRAVGGLALNGFVDWAHFSHFLFDSLLVPKLVLWAFLTYAVVGTPVFLWARRRRWFTPWLFAGIGTVVGYFASFPALLYPGWAAVYAVAGAVSGLCGYAVTSALTRRSSGRAFGTPLS